MSINITYGIGFHVEDVTIDNFLNFLENHAASIIRCFDSKGVKIVRALDSYMKHPQHEMFNKETTKFDLYDLPDELYESLEEALSEISDNENESYKDIIKSIISTETGIDLCFETGASQKGILHQTIMFAETFPWNYSQSDKEITLDVLKSKLEPYINELGLDTAPDYCQSIYYD